MSPTLRHRRHRRRSRPRNKALLAGMVVAILAVLGGLSAVAYVVSIAASAPPLSSLKARNPGISSSVYAANGERLGFIQANELRIPAPDADIPDVLKNATVAIEDQRFYKHKGVDYTGVLRAAIKNLESRGEKVQGGSTITMQLVRALYISDERTFQRKIREAKLAEELETEHDKRWILDTYLNAVPYGTVGGQTALGAGAAARVYFNKRLKKLTLREAALLAGLPQAPTSYSPVRSPRAARERRNEVLAKMAQLGMITPERAQRTMRKGLGVHLGKYFTRRREQYFFDYVKDELIKEFGPKKVKRGGLRVDTTIDPARQREAREAIAGRIAGIGPSGAIVTIDVHTGEILAMASSSDYAKSKFNLAAQGHRQPGSTFKVMALMTAVRKGINPAATSYVSKPLDFDDPKYGPIKVKTYDGTYGGSMNLVRATLRSDNSVYEQLALDVGPDQIAKTAKDMGIRTKLDGYPSEALGGLTIGVSPLEMAVAYATIANGGYRLRPTAIRKITFPDGHSERPAHFRVKRTKVFDDWVTSTVEDILEQNIQYGTGTAANIGCPAAGKTGTTDEHSDAWFVGFTPKLSTAVWVGYPQAQIHMTTEYYGGPVAGGTFPAEIWHDYMSNARGKYCGAFPPAKTIPVWTPFYGRYSHGAYTGPGAPSETFSTPGTTAPGTTLAPDPGTDTTGTDSTGTDTTGTDTTGTGTTGTDATPDTGATGTGTTGNTGTDGTAGTGVDPGTYESPADAGGATAPG